MNPTDGQLKERWMTVDGQELLRTISQFLREGKEWNHLLAGFPLTTILIPNDLRGVDLSNADLRGFKLNNVSLRSANLSGAVCLDTDLSHSDLSNAKLMGVDLGGSDMNGANLGMADLRDANLNCTNLGNGILSEANLSGATLKGARLVGARLFCANLNGANLSGADLKNAELIGANLIGADLTGAYLGRANLTAAKLNGVDLSNANLDKTDLCGADLSEAHLIDAGLLGADLTDANLDHADLSGANLTGCQLVKSKLNGADISGATVYGVSVWGVELDDKTKQNNLVITSEDEPQIAVDNIQVAQFIYLLLTNKSIRDVIDTVAKKVVLILGRFTLERKTVLDAIRTELRARGYCPILFDFEKPANRDITETVSTLAHMARFVIADITDAKSIPQELMSIVPHLPSVAVQPLILNGQREYGMFEHFKKYPWVLPVHEYDNQIALIADIGRTIIAPAETKVLELLHPRV